MRLWKKASFLVLSALVVFTMALVFLWKKNPGDPSSSPTRTDTREESGKTPGIREEVSGQDIATEGRPDNEAVEDRQSVSDHGFSPALSRSGERVTKKPFGIFIDPENSPVRPERFRGYHTGVDFEIFSEEAEADVEVSSVCSGAVLAKRFVSGYGGVLVQGCVLDGKKMTVLYGHLRLDSIAANVGDTVGRGETIALLGDDKSRQTDGERKHLHLAFHEGPQLGMRGYVESRKQLDAWIDPCLFVCSD
jgi:murein DD-endopeptidase MepM/ murein hydrolase activator NlpD